MRNLVIRFQKEGELFRELDEDRNYYFSEAEEIVMKIRKRLEKEKRIVEPKPYECWIDGQRIVITHVSFEKNVSLAKQLEETILGYDAWENEVKHKYINLLKEYIDEEQVLFTNKEFKAFAIRFDQVLGKLNTEPSPFILDIRKQKQIFDGVLPHIDTGFYAKLEEIMNAIKKGYETIVNIVNRDFESTNEESRKDLSDFIEVRVKTWLGNEENFQKFISYVAASYQSVSKKRIAALCPQFVSYQEMQKYLFHELVKDIGFDKAYEHHNKLIKLFYEKYEGILFNGFAIKTDEMVQSLVIKPVIDKFWSQISEYSSGYSSSGKGLNNERDTVPYH